jgi:uncharacterized repeat protein (TIGR03803 family)
LNGVLYGTTANGGKRGYGTVFKTDTSGNERVIYTFTGGADGIAPIDGLTMSGKERIVYSFKWGSDGAAPIAGLTVLHGALYGVTWVGGLKTTCRNFLSKGCGTMFEVSTSGNERVLYRFKDGKDGTLPEGRLLARNGELFGTANKGGKRGCGGAGCGIICKLNNAGVDQVLYRFKGGSDGGNPSAGVISIGGALYGTTTQGGSGCEQSGCGTIFKATASGRETILYRFRVRPTVSIRLQVSSQPPGSFTAPRFQAVRFAFPEAAATTAALRSSRTRLVRKACSIGLSVGAAAGFPRAHCCRSATSSTARRRTAAVAVTGRSTRWIFDISDRVPKPTLEARISKMSRY